MFNLSKKVSVILIILMSVALIATFATTDWTALQQGSWSELLGPANALFLLLLFSIDLYQKTSKKSEV